MFYLIKFIGHGSSKTIVNGQGSHHVTGSFERVCMLLCKKTEWSTITPMHLSVKTIGYSKTTATKVPQLQEGREHVKNFPQNRVDPLRLL